MATTQPTARMTVEEFLVWAEGQQGRFELHEGQVVAMSPKRVLHARAKGRIYRALGDAIRRSGKPCHVLPDGVAVRISDESCYEPDALVYCGAEATTDTVEIANPVVVVEVLSPSTQHIDIAAKLAGYFNVTSIVHYLIVNPERPPIVHHMRQTNGTIQTRILPSGLVELDPPGISFDATNLYV